jgi:hypothetical protein
MNILTTGTIHTNMKGLCKEITVKKAGETQLKKTPSYTHYASYGSMCYFAWVDKRPVHMLTNSYQPVGDMVVKHWYAAKTNEAGAVNGKVQKDVSIPPAIFLLQPVHGRCRQVQSIQKVHKA